MTTEKFEQWCIVELMGHQKIAGKCSEQNIAGSNMLRVDVPTTEKQPGFTRFYSSSAVYAIHPVDEQTATLMAGRLQQAPITIWDMQELMRSKTPELAAGGNIDKDDTGF
ncbi:hypothetical protein [Chitinophaga sancti]|uniref:Uncharacterized protein n=1 Tax=Chitinophaga sancti TaxID=1004 RepID=A0A1K1LZW0_9BACT|nr:hypothetical protein [Chitinophaga sancti]WQD64730.1 hypothetical protein U0033_10015 [Chitinophaga sancti]WQG89648.1 hypothetical protein SR876_32460 [Chitinophaga sancti]SFW16393.1 hypothetical protein SAMN05661012_00340 [Chitinophaga sancti]